MIDENKWGFVSRVLLSMEGRSDKLAKETDGLLVSPESPLLEPQARNEESLVEALSLLIDDDFDSLGWFVYECDYGRKPKEAGKDVDMRLIDSHERLRWLIELTSEQ